MNNLVEKPKQFGSIYETHFMPALYSSNKNLFIQLKVIRMLCRMSWGRWNQNVELLIVWAREKEKMIYE